MTSDALPGYRLGALVHAGHSFEVYEAWSEERSCPVVVKRSRASASPEARDRLLREGTALMSLTHPHLVRAYEVRSEPQVSVVLETLPGQTLAHLVAEHAPLRAHDVAELGRQLASVLGYLHHHGLVHADIKPANVVSTGGVVRLIDLSLAGAPRRWDTSSGTPGYVSPEQAARGMVSAATDVWGLGLLLLEALAGRDPYPVGDPRYREGYGPIQPPLAPRRVRRVPNDLTALIAQMTSLDPGERPDLVTVRAVLDRHAVSRSGVRLGF
jgi:eukaryotic-like serine/threonine-protein kinase